MKKKLTIILVAISCIVTGLLWARWRPAERFEASSGGENTFRIVTWNVGYFAPVENKNMKDLDIDEVSEVLQFTGSQVAILQELSDFNQARRIANRIGSDWNSYSVKTGHGEQVISILTPLPIEFEEDVVCGGRKAKGITVRNNDGNAIYVLGVHSPHPARGISENFESITCSIEHTRNRNEDIRLIGGDLNYNFDGELSDELYSDILNNFGDGTIDIGETYYAHTRIDHLFHYPKDLKVLKEESGMVDLGLRFAKTPGFRDHRPVVVSYQLNQSK